MALYINGNKTGGGSGNADIVHLTQAEYDALSDSKLTDDKVYMITDTNGDGSQFQPVIYSENEREIGVWTDGKPLYQKTIHTGALSVGDYSVAHNISNLDDLISAYGNFIYAGKKSTIPINSRNNINWNLTVADVSSTMINFEVGTNYNNIYAITDSYVTLQYTKTTDVAGSGTWTPQGVPAVHYNTDEQVVGTWIDGSTIYQKTLYKEYAFRGINHFDMVNLEKIISVNGFAKNVAAGNSQYILPHPNESDVKWSANFQNIASTGFDLVLGNNYSTTTSGSYLADIYVTIQYTKSTT